MTRIWTIGHSTLEPDEFKGLLLDHKIEVLADVRSFPGSARCPWFGNASMPEWLGPEVGYEWLGEFLGGRRGPQLVKADVNGGWTNPSFKNYADYALSPAFRDGLNWLESFALRGRVAYMCSEAVPWRCHRGILSDWLTSRGWNVRHIVGKSIYDHTLGRWGPDVVVDDDGLVTYPPAQLPLPGVDA